MGENSASTESGENENTFETANIARHGIPEGKFNDIIPVLCLVKEFVGMIELLRVLPIETQVNT